MVGAPWDGGPLIISYFGWFFIGYHPKKIHHFPYETKPSNKINVQPTCLFQKQPVETRFSPNYPPWRSQKLCQVSGFVKQLLNPPFYSPISIHNYPPGNEHIPPMEKETHLQKCNL